jgi:DNA-binding transcriptional LysR family regulator
VLERAERVLAEIDGIERATADFRARDAGELRIATTHTQARYVLPAVVREFRVRYPAVRLTLLQGSPRQITRSLLDREVDFAIATEVSDEQHPELLTLPAFEWEHVVLVPSRHALLSRPLSLQPAGAIPDRHLCARIHRPAAHRPRVRAGRTEARRRAVGDRLRCDQDVRVGIGLGVGIMAELAYDERRDRGSDGPAGGRPVRHQSHPTGGAPRQLSARLRAVVHRIVRAESRSGPTRAADAPGRGRRGAARRHRLLRRSGVPGRYDRGFADFAMSGMRLTFLIGAMALMLAGPVRAQVVLSVSSWLAPAHPLSRTQSRWCDEVAKVTTRRVTCRMLPRPVSEPTRTFDAVRDGLVDVSYSVHGYTPGRFQFTQMVELPFGGDSAEAMSVAYQRVFQRHLAARGEHQGLKVLAVFVHGPGMVFNTRRPIRQLADMHDLKFRVGGGMVSEIGKALGLDVALHPATETYDLLVVRSLRRGFSAG